MKCLEKYGPPEDEEGNWNPMWTRQNLRAMKDDILAFIKEQLRNCPSPGSSVSSVSTKKSKKKK